MAVSLDTIISLCKRKGFIFQSSEIYGGLAAAYDYGPLGVELKRNVKDAWWRTMIHEREDMEGLDSSILMHPEVWRASGHVDNFTDPLVDCKSCKKRFRADHIKGYRAKYRVLGVLEGDGAEPGAYEVELNHQIASESIKPGFEFDGKPFLRVDKIEFLGAPLACPECGTPALTEPRMFNLMFRTFIGPVQEAGTTVYLRPETAQGIFVNFENVRGALRRKLPFGIAQTGKSFRNEVTTKSFIFRTLEFEQMEIEFFCKPGTDEEWYKHWVTERFNWYLRFGMKRDNMRLRPHAANELAHYARACHDVEYLFPMGWSELEGIANRTDFDLGRHAQFSGKDLTYFDEETKSRYLPYVIEPSAGADRATMAFLIDSYVEEIVNERPRVVLRLHPALAPVKFAVLPLLKNREGIVEKCRALTNDLKKRWRGMYDDTGAIGKLYRRQDEIGTPYCVTVDVESLEDGKATIRERDNMTQERVDISRVEEYLAERLIMTPPKVESPAPM